MEQQQTWRRELPNYKQVAPEIEDLPFQAKEAINVLRGNIQLSGANLKVIAITSAVANEGKSSIAFRLTKSLAGLKKRTLYLDCDIRNSVTMSRYGMSGQVQGLTEYLCGAAAMNDIVYRTPDKYMDVILTGAVAPNPSELVSGKLFTLLLDEMRKRYDYIIVDTCPSLGTLTINALTAADEVIIAVNPQLLAMMGLQDFIRTVKKVRSRLNDRLQIAGILLTMCDARTNLCKVITEQLTETFDGQIRIFKSIIPNTVKVGESIYYSEPLLEYAPENKACKAYRNLAEEVAGDES